MQLEATKTSGGGSTFRGSSSTVSAITQETNVPDSATVATHTTTGSHSTNPVLVRPNTTLQTCSRVVFSTIVSTRVGDSKTIGRVYAQNLNSKDSIDIETTLELDSHANTCVVGEHALIIYDFNRPMDVHGYDKTQGSQRYWTVTAVLKYIHLFTGVTYHLVIHQAIHIPHLPHHLLCPMQCRVNDVVINDLLKFLDPNPSDTSHASLCPVHSLDDDEPVQTVTLLLRL
jgi:hypothetical protein